MNSLYDIISNPNSTYLSSLHFSYVTTGLDAFGTAIMLFLSTLQYQAPYLGQYSGAAASAGQAAFITNGGQALQDKFVQNESKQALDFAHSLGLTDTEMGVVGLTYKTYKDRTLNVNIPKVYSTNINLTIQPDNATVGNNAGIGLNWKF